MKGAGMPAQRTGTAGAGGKAVVSGNAAEAKGGWNLAGMPALLPGRARRAARARAAGKGRARTAARLRARGLRPAAPAPSGSGIAGLAGGIPAEGAPEGLGAGTALSAKRRTPRTSTGMVVDPVSGKEELPRACEPGRAIRVCVA